MTKTIFKVTTELVTYDSLGVEYSKISNMRCIKPQNLYVSRLGLQLSLPNPLRSDVKSRIKL